MPPIPVVRAETFYLPPPARHPEDWSLIPPAQLVFRWVEVRLQRRAVPPEGVLIGQQAYARINHNRWVADCVCGSAQVVSPKDPRMACPECGFGWVRLVFPEDADAVEASVADELPHLRNWWADDDPANPALAAVHEDAGQGEDTDAREAADLR